MRLASPQLAVNTEAEAREARAEVRSVPSVTLKALPGKTIPDSALAGNRLDHFIKENGLTFAGRHLILDLWEAKGLDDIDLIERAMRAAVDASGATLLHIHLHHFSPNGGVSGVAVLAESHISIHTWPECGYAALDIFMCGDAEPLKAVPVFRDAFGAGHATLTEHKRGVV
ncbi:adenosylmethionine decarboxylase [Rhodospirillum rubrum]|uniref:S-adenosylmethionine decarboxylase proenzyme n=1 Tax=Rhodospirillum rubrum (strain ATCC 11170 / ATH 1.1.1 / DSM 467 / LMG 4362 / NCIMB 8255 / S1) TaxID=269796 RepID=Q2RTQ3_RHORT|nr:adenosylmethionine decarboxylase [Rhodospirillum rubrum]ABC22492.1 S-adenosylmethionine decarboxylase related [Rhodospirillum rubrum ATCC 11170]AEO48210.1 s-adenosylmethionine decarboxylase-like protein [Rhodospirillum rubrum F11]MBK1665613.1 adenosylmethionine decarboxylase [Rhodospirillum rubrum]MBK1677458.1 adenosylmethionine decarboxylase [Rhodospirillum rubrum]MBK5954080.1 S-adenosylmethionine decarboxylase proenzyme [Rhodospirillum rubrum]